MESETENISSSTPRETATDFVHLYFPVLGTSIPFDHRYLLYAAINRTMEERTGDPWLRRQPFASLIPIRGSYGNAKLFLRSGARFGLRLPAAEVPAALELAGRELRIGAATIRAGAPRVFPIEPRPGLLSDLVTTRNGQDEGRFDTEIARQLDRIGVRGSIERGNRRFLTIRGRTIIGHELAVTGLTAEESLKLQIHGVGGRRRMGCGVFLPI